MAKRPPSLNNCKGTKQSGWTKPRRKSAHERGYGWEWKKTRLRILKRDKGLCQPCKRAGFTTLAAEVDHVIPKAWGGSDDDTNLQSICPACHKAKTADEAQRSKKADIRLASTPLAHPPWFTAATIPVTVVTGAPGSGKSTYVTKNAGADDRVICFDQIAARKYASGKDRVPVLLKSPQVRDVLMERNAAIGELMQPGAKDRWPAAWIIVSDPQPARRQWWSETLGADIIVMLTSATTCKARVKRDALVGDRRGGDTASVIDQWWWNYSPSEVDQIVRPSRAR